MSFSPVDRGSIILASTGFDEARSSGLAGFGRYISHMIEHYFGRFIEPESDGGICSPCIADTLKVPRNRPRIRKIAGNF